MTIDYTLFTTYKRLAARFELDTLTRHWTRIVRIVRARRA